MPKGKMVFIVEGDLEKKFLEKQCKSHLIIRKIPSNGDSVCIDKIVSMIRAIVELINNPGEIFVVLDREGRVETAEQLEQIISTKLNEIFPRKLLSIHIADRMIENWIIADIDVLLSEGLEIEGDPTMFEGCGGKAKIKAAFRKNNSSYSETVDGVRLLEKCMPTVLAQKSASFSRLYPRLLEKVGFCTWVTKTIRN
jgi:hypothetical protein